MSSNSQRNLKAGIDLSNASRRRQEMNLSLRTKKKEEMLEKKRRGERVSADPSPSTFDQSVEVDSPEPFENNSHFSVDDLPRMIDMITGADQKQQSDGLVMLRKLLSVETNPPLEAVIRTGCLPIIMRYLQNAEQPQNQFEAAWILTNIASGQQQQTHEVVNHNAIPAMLELFQSPSAEVREQSVWAIGNIAGDCSACRDTCLGSGALQKLLWLLCNTDPSIQIVRNIVWTLSNLCRGKPSPDINEVIQALPVVTQLLLHDDDEVVVDAAWAVSYISDGAEDRIAMVIDAGVVPTMVRFLAFAKSSRQVPAIRTIGNIVTGSDIQTQVAVDSGALANFHHLLSSPKRHIRKESLWTISNIAAGTTDQVQAVINSGLLPLVITQLGAPEFEVRKEATWVVSNIAAGGTNQQVNALLEANVITPLCELLSLHDAKATVVALEAIENFLRIGREEANLASAGENTVGGFVDDESNPVVRAIIECGGLNKIDDLQQHKNDEIFHMSARIIDEYFSFDEDQEDMPGEDQETSMNTFQF